MQMRLLVLLGWGALLCSCARVQDGPIVEIERNYPVPVGEAPRRVAVRDKKVETQSSAKSSGPVQESTSVSRSDSASPQKTTPPAAAPAPTPAQMKEEKTEYPFASPVPGKPGFVTSPYAPYAGQIDIQGFAPGSEARDPYTGKIFRVP